MEHERKKRVTVQIYGDSYTIVADELIDHVLKVAGIVDDKMLEMKKYHPHLAAKQLAVLAAVNLVSDHLKGMEVSKRQTKNQKEEE
ncbi:MAG TPA: cell division protein ZapA [Bacillales bacterium]|nr:cell division protein ZapA [Bacillales bacterium]